MRKRKSQCYTHSLLSNRNCLSPSCLLLLFHVVLSPTHFLFSMSVCLACLSVSPNPCVCSRGNACVCHMQFPHPVDSPVITKVYVCEERSSVSPGFVWLIYRTEPVLCVFCSGDGVCKRAEESKQSCVWTRAAAVLRGACVCLGRSGSG